MWMNQAVNGWQATLSPVCKECRSLVGQRSSDSISSSRSMFVACVCMCVYNYEDQRTTLRSQLVPGVKLRSFKIVQQMYAL